MADLVAGQQGSRSFLPVAEPVRQEKVQDFVPLVGWRRGVAAHRFRPRQHLAGGTEGALRLGAEQACVVGHAGLLGLVGFWITSSASGSV